MLHQTTKTYFIPLILGSLIALTGFVFILIYSDPYKSGWLTHAFFYLTIFLSTAGLATLSSLAIRSKLWPGIFSELFSVSARQGALIGVLISGLIFFEALNAYHWWVGLILVLFLLTIEFFFMAPKK